MRNIIISLILLFGTIDNVFAANVWTGEKEITDVQVVEHGGFIIYFATVVNSVCTNAGTKSIYIYPNSYPGSTVTDTGLKAMLSTALVGLSTGMTVNVMYDDSTDLCLGRYLKISK